MRLNQLIEQLQGLVPGADDVYIARLALLLAKETDDLSKFDNADVLQSSCRSICMRMDCLHDQQAAITQELSALASSSPCEFNPQHVWTLVRGIKIQTQLLGHYLD
jgi:hypothetical protein